MGKTRPKNVVACSLHPHGSPTTAECNDAAAITAEIGNLFLNATAPQNLHNSTNRIRKPKTEAQIAKRARKNKQRREKRAVEKARANAKAETQKEPGQRTLMVESEARTARINSLRVSIAQRQEQIARRQAEIALKEAEIERLLAEEAVGRRSKQDEAEGDDADSVDDVDMEVDQ